MTSDEFSPGALGRMLREPLVHFVLTGALLFALFSWLAPDDEKSSRRILITQDRLLEFMQYRNQTFSVSARSRLEEMLQSMTPAQKAALLDDYVREEVLQREAIALGLDNTDYVIRRRLTQTMEYILRGSPEQDIDPPDDDTLKTFFLANAERYESPARVTLRHVFFSASPGRRSAEGRANTTLAALRSQSIEFEEALVNSDRFPYFNDYVDEPRQLIESHLGPEVANAAFKETLTSSWQGPYRFREGLHLIQVTQRTAKQTPEFTAVKELVLDDWRKTETEERLEKRVLDLIKTYRVESAVR